MRETLVAWAEQCLAQATTEQLESWGDQVLDAVTLTEVLGHPGIEVLNDLHP